MQLLTTLLLQFIFIYIALLIGVPGTTKYNILINKVILFLGIFIFQILIKSINSIKKKCNTSIKKLLFNSFYIAVLSVVGYSLYIDLSLMKNTKIFFNKINSNNYYSSIVISTIICSLIFIFNIFSLLLDGYDDCNKEQILYK